jgi:hypothetical protein
MRTYNGWFQTYIQLLVVGWNFEISPPFTNGESRRLSFQVSKYGWDSKICYKIYIINNFFGSWNGHISPPNFVLTTELRILWLSFST